MNSTIKDEKLLLKSCQSGNSKDIEILLTNNIRLIYSYAKRYDRTMFNDIVQEGCIGFLRAIDKYQFNKGTKFSTYASFWIAQAVKRGYHKTKDSVHIPVTTQDKVNTVKKVIREYTLKHHKEPNEQEIINLTGISGYKVALYRQLDSGVKSLDNTINDSFTSAISNLEDKDASNYEHNMELSELNEILSKSMILLNEKEQTVIKLHFGMTGSEPMKLAEIGRELQVSRERIRQIKENALRKIRESEFGNILKTFLN